MSTQFKAQTMVVVGGGMIGLSAALGLRLKGHRVYLIERSGRPEYTESPELRVSALAHHSRALLRELGVWQRLPQQRLGPYTGMQVWDHDSFGHIEFSAAEAGADDLGAIVENKVLEQALWDVATEQGVQIIADDEVVEHTTGANQVTVKLRSNQQLQADYLIAADGNRSPTRERAKLPLSFWDYEQTGIVAVIQTEKPHDGIARQVFLPTGPVAWLPLHDTHLVSLVWSADEAKAQELTALDTPAFMNQLQAASDQCLGKLELVSERAGFPLRMQFAQRWLDDRLILIGDAAHSIHPLAGQGANLGFGDVVDLLPAFATAPNHRELRAWERKRKAAAVTMISAMEAFKRGFGTANPIAKLVRGIGFKAANSIQPLKRQLIKAALGE